MTSSKIILSHLYPQLMNAYVDQGNLKIVRRRLQLAGYEVELQSIYKIRDLDLDSTDFLFIGGGSWSAQAQMVADLTPRSAELKAAITNGLPALFISEAYAALGTAYDAEFAASPPALLHWFEFNLRYLPQRQTGNVLLKTLAPLPAGQILGFINRDYRLENHDENLKPLGQITQSDFGASEPYEGQVYKRWIGTSLHGPVLAKSSQLNDYICQNILDYRQRGTLPAYDYRWSEHAQAQVIARMRD